jgi:hypothetical protein
MTVHNNQALLLFANPCLEAKTLLPIRNSNIHRLSWPLFARLKLWRGETFDAEWRDLFATV